jgi:hypothetical protein
MSLNVNGSLRLIYYVGIIMHLIIKNLTIKHLCILSLKFTINN